MMHSLQVLLLFIFVWTPTTRATPERDRYDCPPSRVLIASYECTKWDGSVGRCDKKTCCPGHQYADGRCLSVDTDVCAGAPCEQQCTDEFGRAHCTCYSGYELNKAKYQTREHPYCEDIDECSMDNGGCLHFCNNTSGSYYCSCRHGYRLDEGGKSCVLIHSGSEDESSSRIAVGNGLRDRCYTNCNQLQTFKDTILKVQSKITILESRLPRPSTTLPSHLLMRLNSDQQILRQGKGEKGEAGIGSPGPNGVPGPPGRPGLPGSKGHRGTRGQSGTHGPPGLTGRPGPRGFSGEKGDQGPVGLTGLDGAMGPRGYTGVAGMSGLPGPKGSKGSLVHPGEYGRVYAKGQKGDVGDSGPMGLMGSRGLTGTKGDAGATGAPGPPGTQITGDTNLNVDELNRLFGLGPRGFTGTKGEKGETASTDLLLHIIAEMRADILKLQRRLRMDDDGAIMSFPQNSNNYSSIELEGGEGSGN